MAATRLAGTAADTADTPPPAESVQMRTLEAAQGLRIGVLTLNQPKTLNALTLDMVRRMDSALRDWAADAQISLVVLLSSSEKAFCAGGDVRRLYQSACANQAAGKSVDSYAEDFFQHEYRLDYLLHRYPKPVLCWGRGVVMGGGLGLFHAASHSVVTETSRLAMPEITIGLFPDAGGTQFLSDIAPPLGLFLGLTGVMITSADVLALGIAGHMIPAAQLDALLAALQASNWQASAAQNAEALSRLLGDFEAAPADGAELQAHSPQITSALAGQEGDADILAAILSLEAAEDPWFERAIHTLRAGCPVTAGIIIEQLRRAARLDLAGRFRMEFNIAAHCMRGPEFPEGVRALLIDKDRRPKWHHQDLLQVPKALIQAHFEPPYEAHPLADLGTTH